MATAEAETSRDERVPLGGSVYDGFISYSHAADDLLAPRLQAGLQRFAKPWWKRRALRIFRDESSLSANPHLWSSITDALDKSGWFVLLLSPEAAESLWVNNEVEYWLEHREPNRIIPVLTDGEFSWAGSDIASNASPPALQGVFADEPRWVDLRFARTEEQQDLGNASFRAAIADIASAIRGVPKDELESEEVRQHRRTIRTAWAGGIALLLLTLLAGATAIYAVGQSNQVATQRDLAEQNAALAEQNAALAQREAGRANAEADRATEEAERANQFAEQMLDVVTQLTRGEASPLRSTFIPDDPAPVPLPLLDEAPSTARLDFLHDFCPPGTANCFQPREAKMVHPELPQDSVLWLAYKPFHIRHGFIHTDQAVPGADLKVFVTRVKGPDLGTDDFDLGTTYLFTSDHVIREDSNRCGPGYATQTRLETCDRFVHEFHEGLPPGQYDFWVEWQAPCRDWISANLCPQPHVVISLFASSVSMSFYNDDYAPADEGYFGLWTSDPWDYPTNP
jgi:hypothetical protein